MSLDGRRRRYLRGLGHGLEPAVRVGKQGLSKSVVDAIESALEAHELVKVKFGGSFEDDLGVATERACAETGAERVARVGRVALLYRRRPEDPRIRLP